MAKKMVIKEALAKDISSSTASTVMMLEGLACFVEPKIVTGPGPRDKLPDVKRMGAGQRHAARALRHRKLAEVGQDAWLAGGEFLPVLGLASLKERKPFTPADSAVVEATAATGNPGCDRRRWTRGPSAACLNSRVEPEELVERVRDTV